MGYTCHHGSGTLEPAPVQFLPAHSVLPPGGCTPVGSLWCYGSACDLFVSGSPSPQPWETPHFRPALHWGVPMRTKNAVGSGVPQAGLCHPRPAEAVPRLGRWVCTGTAGAGESWWQQTGQGGPLGVSSTRSRRQWGLSLSVLSLLLTPGWLLAWAQVLWPCPSGLWLSLEGVELQRSTEQHRSTTSLCRGTATAWLTSFPKPSRVSDLITDSN